MRIAPESKLYTTKIHSCEKRKLHIKYVVTMSEWAVDTLLTSAQQQQAHLHVASSLTLKFQQKSCWASLAFETDLFLITVAERHIDDDFFLFLDTIR